MSTVIKVENLGKKYILSHQKSERYIALRDVITNRFKSFGKKVLRPVSYQPRALNSSKEEFWALQDVSFEINRGDRVGIIGRNGAGKTTLLKLVSRITEPTTGRISLKGRVASLLEVGTGFHPELTGRENIFLNGAILGMGKAEIKRKFDEIVDFAEVEKFLDTPVKRYSSGMYVRLAFAVAAHLEPEILIVDEVLAVGDAQFQKKCLGRMEAIGEEGRTVLFVSHNMGAVQHLCDRGIFLEKAKISYSGAVCDAVKAYLKFNELSTDREFQRRGNKKIVFEEFSITDEQGNRQSNFMVGDKIFVCFTLRFQERVNEPVIAVEIRNILNESFAHIINIDDSFSLQSTEKNQKVKIRVEIPQITFTPSRYLFSLWAGENMNDACDDLIDCMVIDLFQGQFIRRQTPYPPQTKIFLQCKWTLSQ